MTQQKLNLTGGDSIRVVQPLFPVEGQGSIPMSPLHPPEQYVDVNRVRVLPVDQSTAKQMIVTYHYSHRWSSCRYAFGVYYDGDYFDGTLIGCVVYGHPVGRRVCESITKTIQIDRSEILELTRLWIADGYGSNVESYTLGRTFWYLRKLGIRVLLSYADPAFGHIGRIYQATNWVYQGNNLMLVQGYMFKIKGELLHPRTVVARYGSVKDVVLRAVDPQYQRYPQPHKHRYLYVLNKKERSKIVSDLKHPPLAYPKESI